MGGVSRASSVLAALVAALLLTGLTAAVPASAAIAPTLYDPASCETFSPGPGLEVTRCNDGVPEAGGTAPNEGGELAVTVPALYNGYEGLPDRSPAAGAVPGADADGNVALDVDVTLPSEPAGPGGYPVMFLMHGCCGGSKTNWQADEADAPGKLWHGNDSWFASRGYVVVSFTARGFVNGSGRGSTGQTQLDHRAYEINDFQHLACQVLAGAPRFGPVTGNEIAVDPERVIVTGGSYAAAFSWLVMTDPIWDCGEDTGAGGERMRVAAVAPKYGWTDLVHALIPTGAHFQTPGREPQINGCDSSPITDFQEGCGRLGAGILGVPKTSIVAGLYLSGKTGIGANAPHTTFSGEVDAVLLCLGGSYPPPPTCEGTLQRSLPNFLAGRSAYYQNRFFSKIATEPEYRVPVFSVAANTDPLFPASEHRRMHNRLLSLVPDYPLQTYHGDYQHFTQDKDREWGDVCGADDARVCTDDDYPSGDYDAEPEDLVRVGVNSRLSRFLDHYARPAANPAEPEPRTDATVSLQVCPETSEGDPERVGLQFSAPSFERLTSGFVDLDFSGTQTTTHAVADNRHAVNADPVGNQQTNGGACAVETTGAGQGVATYETDPLPEKLTMIGAPQLSVEFAASPGATAVQLNARIYDVLPDGRALLVDRGPRVLTPEEVDRGYLEYETHGNAWRFEPGHRIRLELTQDDQPFVKRSDPPSSLQLLETELLIPVREQNRGRCSNPRTGNAFDNRYLDGGRRGDSIRGRIGDDRLRGGKGADCLNGGLGADAVLGGPGRDKLTGGPGADRIRGGGGRDRIAARDGEPDEVRCGKGRDLVRADPVDELRGCEQAIVREG